MSKKRISIMIVIVVILLIAFLNSQKNSIEDVIGANSNMNYEILHMDQIGNKTIILSKIEDGHLQYTIVKHGIFNYKAIYSGVVSDYERILDSIGILFMELPKQIMDDKIVCFGLVEDDKISVLTLTDNNDSLKTSVKNVSGISFWSADVSEISGSQIVINGYDSEEHIVLEVEEVLSRN
ncbi:hypothetical protein QE109_02025 [Fusibacter bizertensis]|uniref:Uncharacterized protein n=1 Tax=Fusibacter bizertensis TaxID=1488331 RepID=A0ABT6N924_9FIRM|nr:hypothetical protein [Fusibacter bizertensis]MDH8676903.1 hypothetical protein [Fusibacter bizertensis]